MYCNLIDPKKVPGDSFLPQNRSELLRFLFESIKEWINSTDTQNDLSGNQSRLEKMKDMQNPEIQNFYKNTTMVWKNYSYPNIPFLTILPKTCMFHTQLGLMFSNHLREWFDQNPDVKTPQGWS